MTRVLVDENLSEKFAEGLNLIQSPLDNGIQVVSMDSAYGKGTKDEDWIPDWGKLDGIFLTLDLNITRTRHLAKLLSENKMGAFFLKVPDKTPYWERVRIMIKHWPEITEIITRRKKPYNYLITPRKVEKMP
jgi:hypothetical protein